MFGGMGIKFYFFQQSLRRETVWGNDNKNMLLHQLTQHQRNAAPVQICPRVLPRLPYWWGRKRILIYLKIGRVAHLQKELERLGVKVVTAF